MVSKVGRFSPKKLAFFLEFRLKKCEFPKQKNSVFLFAKYSPKKKLTESFGEDVQTSGQDSFVLFFFFPYPAEKIGRGGKKTLKNKITYLSVRGGGHYCKVQIVELMCPRV